MRFAFRPFLAENVWTRENHWDLLLLLWSTPSSPWQLIGANRGSFLCLLPFPGACNLVTGLSCHSRFIQNINSRQRYEGKYIFSIYSQQDDKVGFKNACGEVTSSIIGSDQEFQRPGNHDQLMANTVGLQRKLIEKHTPE
ncbi:triacylglycerol lipase [Oesophagostomum dentatum]|uniref:Triacylglycerol lipase n=1 Tax=Oesophagostomum dentatum TaxID=61180 RepID=A0A0B1S2H3_OESDE|nr:triacylglycerol lipase [Oesophagostomum dentatum]